MLQGGVLMLVTRQPLLGSSRAELTGMLDQLEASARKLLADAKVEIIVFHCTEVSTFAPDLAQGIRESIEAATAVRRAYYPQAGLGTRHSRHYQQPEHGMAFARFRRNFRRRCWLWQAV